MTTSHRPARAMHLSNIKGSDSSLRPVVLRTRTAAQLASACCAFAALVLSGCASSQSTQLINLPNGQQGFTINCSGSDARQSWAQCYQEAGKACGASGYDVVSKDGDDSATGGSVNGLFSANIKNRALVVRCH